MGPKLPQYKLEHLKELNLCFNIMNVKLCLLNQEIWSHKWALALGARPISLKRNYRLGVPLMPRGTSICIGAGPLYIGSRAQIGLE